MGLVLAAGRARRFGANKMIARLPRGELVGVQAARSIAGAVDALSIVVRSGDSTTSKAFAQAGFDVIECPDADRGMAHSLCCGVLHSKHAGAWVIALGDMPHLESQTVAQLVHHFRLNPDIIVPRCDGRAGHPVVFPARFYADLMALGGDSGARAIIEAYPKEIVWVDTEDRGVLRDIDVPDDVEAI